MKKRQLHFCGKMLVLVLVVAVMLVGLAVPVAAEEEDGTYEAEGYTYRLNNDNTATITGYTTEPSGDITIPATLDGYAVTGIGEYAFEECTELTNVALPDSLTNIGYAAFAYCTGLASVHFPDSMNDIRGQAFEGCTSLTSITIPNGVTSIGYLFYGCTNLASVTLPDSLTNIGDGTFGGCTALTSITIPDSVTYIGYGAFSESGLTSITIPGSVSRIEDSAFSYCADLTSVTILDGVQEIGEMFGTFRDCTSLENITIPKSVSSIGWEAFRNCTSLNTVHYNGTKEKWDAISIGEGNQCLLAATLICQPVSLNANNIKVEAVTDELDFGTELHAELQAAGNIAINKIENFDTNNAVVYDIYLSKNGEVVQPSGDVTVSIPVPASMDGSKCKVFHIDASGTATDMNAALKDGHMVFTTNHFSYYAVVEMAEDVKTDVDNSANDNANNNQSNDTDKDMNNDVNNNAGDKTDTTDNNQPNDSSVSSPKTADNSMILWVALIATAGLAVIGSYILEHKKHAK